MRRRALLTAQGEALSTVLMGKTRRYNQLVPNNIINLTSSTSVVPTANTVGSYISKWLGIERLVGHKVYVRVTSSSEYLRLVWYKNNSSGYDIVTGQLLDATSSRPSMSEGIYTIMQDMVWTDGYVQLYYFVFANKPVGSETLTVQISDLTDIYGAGNEPTNLVTLKAQYPEVSAVNEYGYKLLGHNRVIAHNDFERPLYRVGNLLNVGSSYASVIDSVTQTYINLNLQFSLGHNQSNIVRVDFCRESVYSPLPENVTLSVEQEVSSPNETPSFILSIYTYNTTLTKEVIASERVSVKQGNNRSVLISFKLTTNVANISISTDIDYVTFEHRETYSSVPFKTVLIQAYRSVETVIATSSVFSYFPAIRLSDGMAGLYDKRNDKFVKTGTSVEGVKEDNTLYNGDEVTFSKPIYGDEELFDFVSLRKGEYHKYKVVDFADVDIYEVGENGYFFTGNIDGIKQDGLYKVDGVMCERYRTSPFVPNFILMPDQSIIQMQKAIFIRDSFVSTAQELKEKLSGTKLIVEAEETEFIPFEHGYIVPDGTTFTDGSVPIETTKIKL